MRNPEIEIRAFWNRQLFDGLSSGQTVLWLALNYISNELDKDSFHTSNRYLEVLTGLSRKGVFDAKQVLVKKNYIAYTSGDITKQGTYTMLPLARK